MVAEPFLVFRLRPFQRVVLFDVIIAILVVIPTSAPLLAVGRRFQSSLCQLPQFLRSTHASFAPSVAADFFLFEDCKDFLAFFVIVVDKNKLLICFLGRGF